MFFQISPVRREKKPKPTVKQKSPEKVEVLSLAPFSAAPKLFFDGVKLGEPAICKLLLRNPTKQDITIFLIRKVPEELHVAYNWEDTTIDKNSEVLFEVIWTPKHKESSYHKITFEDSTKSVHRDVPIVFKTASPIKQSRPEKKIKPNPVKQRSPRKTYYPVRPPYVSPKRYSPKKKTNTKSPSPNKYYTNKGVLSPQKKSYITQAVNYNLKGKENVPTVISNTEDFISSENITFKCDYLNTIDRRDTFVLKRENSEVFNDSLEIKNYPETFTPQNIQKRPPLKTYNGCAMTPDVSFGSYFTQKSFLPETPNHGYEYKLTCTESYCFTPTTTDIKRENFQPEESSTIKKQKVTKLDVIHVPNLNSEIYVNSRLSSETYVNDNASFETYVKGNLSGETYTKDSSVGRLENLSPLSTKMSPNCQGGSTPSLSSYLQDISSTQDSKLCNTERFKIDRSGFSCLHSETDRNEVDDTQMNLFIASQVNQVKYTDQNSIGPRNTSTNQFNYARPSHFNLLMPKVVNDTGNLTPTRQDCTKFNYAQTESTSQFNFVQTDHQLSSIAEESFDVSKNIASRKKSDLDLTANYARPGGGFTGPKNWSRRGGSSHRVAKNTSGLNLRRFVNGVDQESQEGAISKISKKDTSTVIIQNPFLLAATNMVDPFITPQLYVSDKWIDQQEIDFKKWLNSLLTPPHELYSEDKVIDVAKVWQECKKREVEAAPTKETISKKYHVNAKLNSLRKSAQTLFRSKEMSDVLSKVILAIDNKKLSFRQDKDVHLNISTKSLIMSVLLSYNPLWLRIGLETIYNETVPLHSNSDIVGLSTFLINRLFKHPYLLKKYKSIHSPKYVTDFNKFFLKKFTILVYFLDQAKNRKLIPHNPCLFCKTGIVKESKEVLLILARELLSAVGDITKFLKFSGYVVTHVQTYIHEFEYAVNNLGVDLRDGVRLTKIMEIILLKEDLTNGLRVPAISRLQKVHNMKLVFDSLENAGYKILYDINCKDIVDGHREKTMSFLWQIIYKFEAPLMVKCANTIQIWFRSLPVVLKRRRLKRHRLEKENAASKIQKWYRKQKLSARICRFSKCLKQHLHNIKIQKAVVKIQAQYRMYRQTTIYKKQLTAIKEIQRYSRGWLIRHYYKQRIMSAVVIQSYVRMFVARNKYLKYKRSVQLIQVWYRSKKQTEIEAKYYQTLKSTTIFVQQRWKANVLAKKQKQEYEKLKRSAINVQKRFRANYLCRKEKQKYQTLKSAAIHIQTWYRSIKIMKFHRNDYVTLKRTVLIVEQRYVALQIVKTEKLRYQKLRCACLTIQKHYRTYKLMKEIRIQYLQLRIATLIVQQRFRAKQSMQYQRTCYNNLKKSTVFMQRQFRAKLAMQMNRAKYLATKEATIKIQTWFRATVEMRKCRKYYISLKHATRIVKEKYRSNKLTKKAVLNYRNVRNAIVVVQRRYRALVAMRKCKNEFDCLKSATLSIQRRWRANKAANLQRARYLQLKNAAETLQTRYRARQTMLVCRKDFETLRNATLKVQTRYRAQKLMRRTRREYQTLLKCTVTVQRLFRAKHSMLKDRKSYERLKLAVRNTQMRWRAKKLGKEQKKAYDNLRRATIIIQQKWKATRLATEVLKRYEALSKATIFIQRRWRANKLSRKAREDYLLLRKATLTLQSYWRAKRLREIEQHKFKNTKNATLVIQRRFRATMQAKCEKKKFENLRNAVITVQTKWRAYRIAKIERETYQRLCKSSKCIQQHWRAKIASRKQRLYYLRLKESTLLVQQIWRAKVEGRKQLQYYTLLKKTSVFLQQTWRAKIEARYISDRYIKLRSAIILVQNRWRCKVLGRKDRRQFQQLKLSTIYIQRRWRCLKLGKGIRDKYLRLRSTTIFIQQRFRATKLMKFEVQQYTCLRNITITIQRRFRAVLEMKRQIRTYTIVKKSIITIQTWYRSCLQMKKERNEYLVKKRAVQEIQKHIKGHLIRKKYAHYFTPEAREKRRIEKMENNAATKIQSFWRGYKSRCRDNPEMGRIRKRYIKAKATALPENTLQFKCKLALQIIAHEHSTLFHINHALEDIDYATRRCKNICITLGKLLPDQLCIMLSSTSRSLPEMTACIFSVNILINFNKLKETKNFSFIPDYIEKLVTLMINWCDKESQLFPALCTLFWLFAHTPQWRRFILNLPNIRHKFEKMKGLVGRKENMVKKQVTKGATVFGSYKNLPMPAALPDWGLDYPTNPFAFTNSVHALNSLITVLTI